MQPISIPGRNTHWFILISTLLCSAHVAHGQSLADARPMLESNNRATVETGIQTMGLIGTPETVPLLAARIRKGLPPELLEVAMITLSAIADPSGTPIMVTLAQHRRAEVRENAMAALAIMAGEGAYEALIKGLSDADDKVRLAAATALGDLGQAAAGPALFAALDAGNMAASSAIGKVTPSNEATRLLNYLGKLPFHNVAPALLELLRRKDIKEPAKLQIVTRIADLATPEARRFLTDAVASIGTDLGQRVSRSALHAAKEIPE